MTKNPLDNIQRRPAREPRAFPDPVYDEMVLKPLDESADRLLHASAVQVHSARIVDLIELRTIEKSDGVDALLALCSIPHGEDARHHPLASVERVLSGVGGGSVLLASAPEEVAVTAMRIVVRDRLLAFAMTMLDVREALSGLALEHLTTAVTATSNGQMVQPTTLAHYLTGQLGPFVRTFNRVQESYSRTNRSPLGAVSGMATAVPMRRERLVQLLGFDGPVENTFDAIASADVEQEIMAILSGISIEATRLVMDLIQWARDDVGTIAPADEFIHHGSSQPQRRDPRVLDHLRIRLAGHTAASNELAMVLLGRSMLGGHATRYETFFRVEHELTETARTFKLLIQVLGTLVVNRALTANRAHRGFATSSELADLLAIDCQLPRDQAYALAERIATEATILGLGGMTVDTKLVDKLALEVVGREVGIEPETLGKCLAVKRFIERREVLGGPAPATVRDMIEREGLARKRDASWINERRAALAEAEQNLRQQIESQISVATEANTQ